MQESGDSIRVLHVDDDPDFADTVATFLEREDGRLAVETAATVSEGLEKLATVDVDCVVSDYGMPDQNGIDFLKTVRETSPEMPFILYTGKGSEEVASEAISAGVTEYLQKESGVGQYTVLANRIVNAVERRRARSELADRERRLELFFEESPIGVIEWNEAFELRRMNEAAEDILGYSEADLVGDSWERIVPESEREDVREIVSELLEDKGGYHSVNENVRADGDRIVCEWHNRVVTDERNEVIAVFSQFREVTERRRRKRRLETLIDNLPGMVYRCLHEPGWPMLQVGGTVEALTGYEPRTLEEQPEFFGREIIHPDDYEDVWRQVQDALEAGEPFEVTYRIVTAHGETKRVWERGQRVSTEDGVAVIEGFVTDITEREAALEELRTEREFTEQALDALEDLFYVVDPDGQLRRWNDRVPEVTGYSEAELGDLEAVDLFPADEHERVARAIDETLTTGHSKIEAELRTADGEHIPHEFTGSRLTDSEGEVIGLAGIGRDISDRRARERARERTTPLLSTLIETLPVGVLAEDDDRTVMAVNERLLDLFDIEGPPESLLDADCERLAVEASDMFVDSDGFVDRIEDLVSARQPVDGETLRLVDGRSFERAYRPIDLPNGSGHLWMYRDVTEEREIQRKLTALHDVGVDLAAAESVEAICERTVEASEDILEFDLSGIDLERDGSLVKVAASEDIEPEEMTTMSVDEGIAGKTYRTGESFLIRDLDAHEEANPQGTYRSAISIPIGTHGVFQAVAREEDAFDESDLELAELLITHAESALSRLDRERRLRDQNERLEEFASIVSHDLRNPLNVVQGRIELAREDCESDHLDAAANAADRSLQLIDDLLTLAREGGDVRDTETVSLRETADGCWQVVETADARLRIEGEQTVRANQSRLKQLLENLFRNAIEHGGENVTVTVGSLPDGFYVADDGRGIPEADREKVFESGYSTAGEGTGFGLDIVQEIAHAHGWAVHLTEGEDGGARFEFTDVDVVG